MLDEPTAALDIGHQETVLATARERAGCGCGGAGRAARPHPGGRPRATAWCCWRAAGSPPSGAPRDVLEPTLLSRVYRHPVEVVPHPRTGDLIVLADRTRTVVAVPTDAQQEDPC